MQTLSELSERLGDCFRKRENRFIKASRFVKFVLIIGGTSLAGVAQFAALPDNQKPGAWTFAGIAAVVLVCIGAIFVALMERDSSEELETARAAVAAAQAAQAELSASFTAWEDYEKELARLLQLYAATDVMRSFIDAILVPVAHDETDVIKKMLHTAKRPLLMSLGFEMNQHWTMCVYKAVKNTAGDVALRCIAQERSIDCDINLARLWPAGVGVGGSSYSHNREIIVPDLAAPELGTAFSLTPDLEKKDDGVLYRSIAAVPVASIAGDEPWGVIIVTSDHANHFDPDESSGVRTVEPVRALAAMVGLAIKAMAVSTAATTTPPTRAKIEEKEVAE